MANANCIRHILPPDCRPLPHIVAELVGALALRPPVQGTATTCHTVHLLSAPVAWSIGHTVDVGAQIFADAVTSPVIP